VVEDERRILEALEMIEVDARGLSCPIPVVRTKQALDKNPDECCVLVDAYVQVENITRLAQTKGYECKSEQVGDAYRITLKRKGAGNA
jgi:tRNA 2-thiouridine synthesizing protein A